MNIVEKNLVGKHVDQSLCEDGIFISNDFIAVIDVLRLKGNYSRMVIKAMYMRKI